MVTATLAPFTVAPVELDFEARLAATDAEMTVRLEQAGVAVDVYTAHLPEAVDWADVVTAPIAVPAGLVDLYPTPVAALLQRAHTRIVDGGWCRGYSVDGQGATCLAWAIHREARGDVGLEVAGLNHLLDTIRAEFDPGAETVASWNDSHRDGRIPLRILGAAADTAATRGI